MKKMLLFLILSFCLCTINKAMAQTVTASGQTGDYTRELYKELDSKTRTISDTGSYVYGTKATTEATPNAAEFAAANAETCTLTANSNNTNWGIVAVDPASPPYTVGQQVQLTARPFIGSQFVRWTDGSIDNPRSITLTQDTTLTAVFADGTLPLLIVTVQSNATQGLVSGGSRYTQGEQAVITAIPNTDYRFVRWADYNIDNPRTITVTQDMTLTAVFVNQALQTFTVTGAVSESSANMGEVNPPQTKAATGEQIVFTATPKPGYKFFRWSDGNAESPRTITVTQDTTLTALFVDGTLPLLIVTVQSNATQGLVTGGSKYTQGEQAVIRAIPNTGYQFVRWADYNIDNPRTITVTQDTTLTAVFVNQALQTFTVTGAVSESSAGMGEVKPPRTKAATGEQIVFTATPNTGYKFFRWSDGNGESPRTITVTQDTTLRAVFVSQGLVTFAVNGAVNEVSRGMVNPSHTNVQAGAQVVFTATPNTGYRFVRWADYSVDNPRTVTVTQDTTLTAVFVSEGLVTFVANGAVNQVSRGMVNPTYTEALAGELVVFRATPKTGFQFLRWTDGNADNPRTVTVTQDTTLTAVFVDESFPTVIVTTLSDVTRGLVIGGGPYTQGEQAVLRPTPNTGYQFLRWADGNIDNPRTVTVMQDTTLIGLFVNGSLPILTVTALSNVTQGLVTGGSRYTSGEQVVLRATPKTGFQFLRWTDGNGDNPRTITVTQDTTLTAVFADESFPTVIVTTFSDVTRGLVIGGGRYTRGDQAVLRPTANTGYQFLRWADGNIDNPRTVTVVQDTTLTAVFGNGSLPILTVTVRSNVTQGLVTGGSRYTSGEQAVIRAIPNVGYRFVRWTDGNGDNPRTITVTGNMTFTAEFVAEMYTLTVNSNNSGWGTVAVNPVGPYTLNQQVVLTPNAVNGYRFVKWNDNTTDNPRTITVTGDLTVSAEFTVEIEEIEMYTLTVNSNDENRGRVTVAPAGPYTLNQQVVLTPNAATGSHFVKWNDNITDNPRIVTVTSNMTFTAEFVAEMYTLTVNSSNSDWGTVAVNPVGPYTLNQQVVLTPNAVNGYRFAKWNDNTTDNPRTITVTGNMTVSAEFTVEMYTLTVNSNDENRGRVTVAPAGPYTLNQQVVLTPNAVTGSRFVKWDDNITDNPRIVTVTSNMTFTAEFAANAEICTLTVNSNNDTWGTVAVNPAGPYTQGQQVVLTPNPANGYRFVKWNDDNTDNPRTITVTGDMTFTAEFFERKYTLTVNSNDENWGTVTVAPTGTYTYGQQVVLTANTVNSYYHFVKWNDDITDNPRTITVTRDTTLTAVFATNAGTTYTLTVTSNYENRGTVTVNPASPYTYGQSVTLTAAAVNGYRFVKWADNVTVNPRTITVIGNMTFTAEFEQITGTITGNGSEADPYRISSKTDMEQLATAVNGGQNYSGVYFRLTCDLTGADDILTTSVGNSNTTYFSGIFDGDGHKIAVNTTGVFGRIRNATIKNLGVTGRINTYSSYPDNYYYAGGICATTENSTINNCYNNAEITISAGSDLAQMNSGGICGQSTNSNISNCYNTGSIYSTGNAPSSAGGIIGRYESGGAIINCYNTGSISVAGYEPSSAGGITGRSEGGGTLTNCYNTGSISATAFFQPYSGGITGAGGTITNCYNTGSISAFSYSIPAYPAYCGGINGAGGTITNCYNTGSISATASADSYSGGICGSGGTVRNCFVANMQITTNDIPLTYTGRIGGNDDGNYADCYADGVSVNGNPISGTDKNGKNGLDATLADLQSLSWLTATLGWDFTYNWSMTSAWPELKKVQPFAVRGAVSKSSAGMGSVNPSDTIAVTGEQVVFTATPATGYQFVQWQEDGNKENPRTVTIIGDMTFTAEFGAKSNPGTTYTLTVTSNDDNWGTVTVNPAGPYTLNQQVVLTANPVNGCQFRRWNDDVTVNPRTITVTGDMNLKAEFAVDPTVHYALTVGSNNENWGMVTVNPADPYTYGQQVVLTAAAVNGYRFVKWNDNVTVNPRTIAVIGNMTFEAEFAVDPTATFTLTVNSNNANWGAVTVNPAGPYMLNQQVVLTATAVNGYRFVKWNDNVTVNPRTIAVIGNMTFEAEFAVDPTATFTLTVNSNNANWGAVTINPAGPYTYGRQVVLTATAVNGYRFAKWSDNSTVNPRTVTVTGDMTITAEFAVDPTATYTLTVNSNYENRGAVTINPAGPYMLNQQVVLTATAVSGYRFAKWSDNSTVNPRTVTVTGNMTFTAEFAAVPTYLITVRASNTNWGTVDGEGRYSEYEEVEITAIPKSGYHFDQWLDKNTDNPRLITVTANATYIAVFAEGSDDTSEIPTPFDPTVVIYPNPVRDVLYIRSAVAIEQVVIRDLSGQQVKQIASPVGREIDVSDLAAGVYLVGITTTAGETIRKIVISD